MGAAVGAAVILLGLAGLWAAGVIRVKTADGSVLVVEVNEPNPDVFVDGEKVTVTWGDGGKRAEVGIRPGTRKVEVKKDGFTAYGEEVEFQEGKRRVLTARLDRAGAAPAPKEANAGEYDLTGGRPFVHFGPGGPRVVLGFSDNQKNEYFARVYDLSTGQPISPPLPHGGIVDWEVFSPDGKRVATASRGDRTARVWDATSGKEITPPIKHDGEVQCATFSPDGKRVATASDDKTARVWDAATAEPVTPPLKHEDAVWGVAFSPDGSRVVTASKDRTARVWDAATGRAIGPPLKHSSPVLRAEFSPDGKRIVTAADKTARVWNAATGEPLTPLLQHDDAVESAQFSPDGKRIVTASFDKTARVWDAATGEAVSPPLRHEKYLWAAMFSPDGKRVATACADGTARVWDATTGEALTPPLQHPKYKGVSPYEVLQACFSPNGKQLVTRFRVTDAAALWDAASGEMLKQAGTKED
jgi:WD40 repeat protein